MKPILLFCLVFSFLFSNAQNRISVPKNLRDKCVKREVTTSPEYFENQYTPIKKSTMLTDEEQIGDTRYDNQSNASIPKKYTFMMMAQLEQHGPVVWKKDHSLLTVVPDIIILMEITGVTGPNKEWKI